MMSGQERPRVVARSVALMVSAVGLALVGVIAEAAGSLAARAREEPGGGRSGYYPPGAEPLPMTTTPGRAGDWDLTLVVAIVVVVIIAIGFAVAMRRRPHPGA